MCSVLRKRTAKRRLDDLLRDVARSLPRAGEPFWRLVQAIQSTSRLLAPVPERGRVDPNASRRMAIACARMTVRHPIWHRPPETWTAPDASPCVQFRSLVSHLFDRYPVPNFMASVWLCEQDEPWELDLYLHLALGSGIRQFAWPTPVRMTKSAAAFFLRAPDDLRPWQAWRWAHIRSLGGDDRLARLLLRLPILAVPTPDEEFWETVIQFLAQNQPIPEAETVLIVEFIRRQRFEPGVNVWGYGAGARPLQPDFTLRGRSLASLRRHMETWRDELAPRFRPAVRSVPAGPLQAHWERADIRRFQQPSDDGVWTIDELLSDKELRVEGGIMQHCVANYIPACARRETSIWSLKLCQGERRDHVATIEVGPQTRLILQAKGRKNARPGEAALAVLRQWASQEGLRFDA